MAKQVAVVTDSISCLNKYLVSRNGIRIVPATFTSQGKVYRDWVDVSPTEAYEIFLKDPDSFGTSPPAPMEYVKVFRELGEKGKDILCITITSKFSAMYDTARAAAGQVSEEFPAISIEVLDSLTTTAAEGLIALAAARTAAEDKGLNEVIRTAKEVKDKVNFYILLGTIRHVYRSGRIPKIASVVGSKVNIKPILTMSSGLIKFAGAARSMERGMGRLLEILRSQVGQSPVRVAVMHAYAPERAEILMKRLSAEFNCTEL